MTENAIIGGCFDGIFNINGIITRTFENLINLHHSNGLVISSVVSSGNMHTINRHSIDSESSLKEYNLHPGKYKFRKNRMEPGVDCVAGYGIALWDTEDHLSYFGKHSKLIESFGSFCSLDGVVTAGGPIGGTMFVYSIE
jgi:hypothetical protein